MQFGILGPLEVLHDGEQLPLGGPRQRAVLARLVLSAGRPVPIDRLVDDVWDGRPPATAHKSVQKYVSALRQVLPDEVLRTDGGGYVLEIDDEAVDARRFERLVRHADHASALALWRGDVLADMAGAPFVAAERARLDELRLEAIEAMIERRLDQGDHAGSIAELGELAERHPFRERLTALLMLALYRSGRQVEALRAFETHRRQLAEEVGVEPATELRALESAILRHDPDLDLPHLDKPPSTPPSRFAGNVPLSLTTFVGRTAELGSVEAAVAEHRLVTLLGPGGVGKTRLALEVAARVAKDFEGGVWVVDLAGVEWPDRVADATALVLSVDLRQVPDEREALVDALTHRPACLLVFDNCEHLVESCAVLVERVLRSCPHVHVLTTSRRAIGVVGEYVSPVAPLRRGEAVTLFWDRARLTGIDVTDTPAEMVASICEEVDDLPLAIELAASQLRVLEPTEMAARLHHRLRFRGPTEHASRRQRTLHDMVSWSHDLLPPATQAVFARLGVFTSSFTLDAAEAVCAADDTAAADLFDHITVLVDHSLLTRQPAAATSRYRLLETLRLFALERLALAGDTDRFRRAHAVHLQELAERAGPRLYGPDERLWLTRLELEEPNLHAALGWSLDHDPALGMRLAVALWRYWDVRWGERHAVAYLEKLIALGDDDAGIPEDLRAWGFTVAADLAGNPGEARQATEWGREAVRRFRRLGDEAGLACALVALGAALGNQGALNDAETSLAEALELAHRLGDDFLIARTLSAVSFVAYRRGDHRLESRLNHEELACWRALGSPRGEATALRHLAVAAQHGGELERAADLCRQALDLWQVVDDPTAVAHVRLTMADIARLRGDLATASALYEEALQEFQTVGDRRCTASTFKNLGAIAAGRGLLDDSTELLRRALALRHDLGDVAGLAECFDGLAGNALVQHRPDRAVTLLTVAAGIRERTGVAAYESIAVTELAVRGLDLADRRYDAARRAAARLSIDEAVAVAMNPG